MSIGKDVKDKANRFEVRGSVQGPEVGGQSSEVILRTSDIGLQTSDFGVRGSKVQG